MGAQGNEFPDPMVYLTGPVTVEHIAPLIGSYQLTQPSNRAEGNKANSLDIPEIVARHRNRVSFVLFKLC